MTGHAHRHWEDVTTPLSSLHAMRTAATGSAMPLSARVRSPASGTFRSQPASRSALTRTSPAPAAAEMPGGAGDRRAEVVVVVGSGLAGMEPDADGGSETVVGAVASERPLDRGCAGDAVVWLTEGHEEPIATVLHLLAAPSGELSPQDAVVPAQQLLPGVVTHRLGEPCRIHDVGEEEGPHSSPSQVRVLAE